jgi:hypothetical protein
MLHDPAKTYEHRASSEAQAVRPNIATIGPRNDLTGILVCRRSVGFNRHLRVSPAIMTRPSPPGLARSANCAWRTPVLQTVQGYRHRASSEAHPSVSRTLTSASGHSPSTFGHSPEPPGSTERLRAFTGAPSFTNGTFETHRTTRSSTDNFGCPPDDFGRPPGASFATSVLGCSPEPPGSTRVPSETHRSQFVQTRRSTAIASFRYNGPLVRRPLAELCTVSGATVVTFESTPGFRLSYRR